MKREKVIIDEPFGEEIIQEKNITLEELFIITGSKIPPALLRSLDNNFLFGIHAFTENNPFLLFTVRSFNNAFSGMLEWEKTIFDDLTPLFALEQVDKDTLNRSFEDVIIENQDLRALKDKEGNIVLLYAFANQETLIITTHEVTLDEILERLKRPKKILR